MRTLRVWLEVHTASKSHRTRKDFKERAITFLCLVLKIKGRNLSKKDKRKETRNNFRSQGIKKTTFPVSLSSSLLSKLRIKQGRKEILNSYFLSLSFPRFQTQPKHGKGKRTRAEWQHTSPNAHIPKPLTQSNKQIISETDIPMVSNSLKRASKGTWL